MRRPDRTKALTSIGQTLNQSRHPVLEEAVRRHQALSPLKTAWQRSVPLPLRHHAQPVSRQDGTLVVRADSPVWANLLRNTEQTVIAALRHAGLTGVLNLHIRISPPSLATAIPPADEQDGEYEKFRRLFAQLRKALD